jgi:hypothetical protein
MVCFKQAKNKLNATHLVLVDHLSKQLLEQWLGSRENSGLPGYRDEILYKYYNVTSCRYRRHKITSRCNFERKYQSHQIESIPTMQKAMRIILPGLQQCYASRLYYSPQLLWEAHEK